MHVTQQTLIKSRPATFAGSSISIVKLASGGGPGGSLGAARNKDGVSGGGGDGGGSGNPGNPGGVFERPPETVRLNEVDTIQVGAAWRSRPRVFGARRLVLLMISGSWRPLRATLGHSGRATRVAVIRSPALVSPRHGARQRRPSWTSSSSSLTFIGFAWLASLRVARLASGRRCCRGRHSHALPSSPARRTTANQGAASGPARRPAIIVHYSNNANQRLLPEMCQVI